MAHLLLALDFASTRTDQTEVTDVSTGRDSSVHERFETRVQSEDALPQVGDSRAEQLRPGHPHLAPRLPGRPPGAASWTLPSPPLPELTVRDLNGNPPSQAVFGDDLV